MKRLICLIAIALVFTCSGCDSVSLAQPFGKPVDANERAKLVGTWQFGNAAGQVEVKQTSQGELVAGMMQWDKANDRFKVDNVELVATQFGDHKFIHMRNMEEPLKQKGWNFLRYEHAGENELLTFGAVVNQFQQGVEKGQLKGTVKKKDKRFVHVTVTSSAAEVEAFFKACTVEACFGNEPLKLNLRKE